MILYGIPIWSDAQCSNPSYGTACLTAWGTILLRVVCAFSTVPDIALSIVAGLPPVDLIAGERAELDCKGMIREEDDFYYTENTLGDQLYDLAAGSAPWVFVKMHH